MAAFATGFTKLLEANNAGTNSPVHSARTMEESMTRESKGRMLPIIEGQAPAADEAV